MTFKEFATSEVIIYLLARERAKCVRKNRNSKYRDAKGEPGISTQLERMLPPHGVWVRPGKLAREKHDSLWCSTHGIINAVRNARKNPTELDRAYLKELDLFIERIQERAGSNYTTFSSPKTAALFKKEKTTSDGVKVIYRPISIYSNLEDKILIALASRYLMKIFNSSLHEEILSYRPARRYHGSQRMVVTNQENAVANAIDFRNRHNSGEIWVAECDIQKFYDIINHDVIMECFDDLAKEKRIRDYDSVRPFLLAYLESYNFPGNVLSENDSQDFWQPERSKYRHGKYYRKSNAVFCFEWVSEKDFTDPVHGCYSKDEFKNAFTKLGVPQGGALSPVIADVVMNSVDGPVIEFDDPNRFFNRYGDDILLMHISQKDCHNFIEAYRSSLREHRFIYHPFEDFSLYKKGKSTRRCYWDAKSKDAFLWGDGEGTASQWIGFVGYEISRDGNVRLRRSSLDKKFSQVNRTYHKVLSTPIPDDRSGWGKYEKSVIWRLTRMTESISKCSLLTANRFSSAQMACLDRYRQRKIHKMKEIILSRHYGYFVYDVFKKMASKDFSFNQRLK